MLWWRIIAALYTQRKPVHSQNIWSKYGHFPYMVWSWNLNQCLLLIKGDNWWCRYSGHLTGELFINWESFFSEKVTWKFDGVLTNLICQGVISGSRVGVTSKMERFVIIVNGWKPLTIITKRSILDVAAALYPPLKGYISGTLTSYSVEKLKKFTRKLMKLNFS